MSPSIRSRRPHRLLAVVIAAVVTFGLAACSQGGADAGADAAAPAAQGQLPEWLSRVYPPPGAETTATRAVQVDHGVVAPDEELRLLIDDVDVTTYARTGPGLLEYDVDQATAPVELEPGTHRATLEYYRVEPGASEGTDSFDASTREVIDTFTWQFELS